MKCDLPAKLVRRGEFSVRPVSKEPGRSFVETFHYSRGISNAPTAIFGLFDGAAMVGACAFATPISENVRASVFGVRSLSRVTELHRLVLMDWVPHNAESLFVAEALRQLKEARPDLWFVLSFADTAHGHVGTVYQASNALWCGTSAARSVYVDETGRMRHRRQCGRNISRSEALARGWKEVGTGVKHRYGFLLPDDRRHARRLREDLLLTPKMPYPKLGYRLTRS